MGSSLSASLAVVVGCGKSTSPCAGIAPGARQAGALGPGFEAPPSAPYRLTPLYLPVRWQCDRRGATCASPSRKHLQCVLGRQPTPQRAQAQPSRHPPPRTRIARRIPRRLHRGDHAGAWLLGRHAGRPDPHWARHSEHRTRDSRAGARSRLPVGGSRTPGRAGDRVESAQ